MTVIQRTFSWRLHNWLGGHPLVDSFGTPEAAGEWRRKHFPGPDDAPLTLVAFEGGREVPLRASELAAAHWSWLYGRDSETAAGRDDTPTPAA